VSVDGDKPVARDERQKQCRDGAACLISGQHSGLLVDSLTDGESGALQQYCVFRRYASITASQAGMV
jgi:hypothetical protein